MAHARSVCGVSWDSDLLPARDPEGEGWGNCSLGHGAFIGPAGGNARGKKGRTSRPGPGGSEERDKMAGDRRLERIGPPGRNSPSHVLWAAV